MPPHLKGRLAEALAMLYYLAHGWLPAPRPPRLMAQLDLLLTRPFTKQLIIVEVKYRRTATSSALALSHAQIQRQRRTAQQLTRYYPHHTISLQALYLTPQFPFCRRVLLTP